jgi:hypothetical protein
MLLVAGALGAEGGHSSGRKTFRFLWKWIVALVVAALAVGGSRFVEFRIDVTRARTNTLAAESVAVVRSLKEPVRVVAFLEEGSRTATELVALVDRYSSAHDRLAQAVQLELRSAKRGGDLELARALGLAEHLSLGGPNLAVVPAATNDASQDTRTPVRLRFDAGLPDAEEQLTNALRKATTTSAPTRVYVVAGHGEPDLRDDGPGGLSQLRDALRARHIELVPLPLAVVGGRIPDDAWAVVVLPSVAAWSLPEEAAVRSWLDADGALFLLLEPDQPHAAAAAWAARVGVDVLPDVVIDEGPFATLLGGADTVTGSTQLGHAVTRSLRGALTHFPRAVALGLAPITDVTTTPVVSTGPDARAPKLSASGPLPLLVAAERTTSSAKASSQARVIVGADATFLQNGALGLGANRDLALNAVQWLAQDDDHIAVRPRRRGGSLVLLTPSAREALAFVLLVLIPGVLLAVGSAITSYRRAR